MSAEIPLEGYLLTTRVMVRAVTCLTLAMVTTVFAQTEGARDLSTPSKRLVGHWVTETKTHYYFGRADSTDIGPLTWVENNGEGAVVKHRYKIISEVPKGEDLTLQIQFGAGGDRVDRYVVAKDGQSMTFNLTIQGVSITEKLIFVDGKMRPD